MPGKYNKFSKRLHQSNLLKQIERKSYLDMNLDSFNKPQNSLLDIQQKLSLVKDVTGSDSLFVEQNSNEKHCKDVFFNMD